ncbi:MAG: hypothetical protein AAGC92_16020 [Pseudomonadota bacterium]
MPVRIQPRPDPEAVNRGAKLDPTTSTFENPYHIGNDTNINPHLDADTDGDSLRFPFGTRGLHQSPGLLTMMVRGMAPGPSAHVRIASAVPGSFNTIIGVITGGTNTSVWYHHQFKVPTNVLSGANNEAANVLHLGLARRADNSIDDYFVRDIVRFFYRAS